MSRETILASIDQLRAAVVREWPVEVIPIPVPRTFGVGINYETRFTSDPEPSRNPLNPANWLTERRANALRAIGITYVRYTLDMSQYMVNAAAREKARVEIARLRAAGIEVMLDLRYPPAAAVIIPSPNPYAPQCRTCAHSPAEHGTASDKWGAKVCRTCLAAGDGAVTQLIDGFITSRPNHWYEEADPRTGNFEGFSSVPFHTPPQEWTHGGPLMPNDWAPPPVPPESSKGTHFATELGYVRNPPHLSGPVMEGVGDSLGGDFDGVATASSAGINEWKQARYWLPAFLMHQAFRNGHFHGSPIYDAARLEAVTRAYEEVVLPMVRGFKDRFVVTGPDADDPEILEAALRFEKSLGLHVFKKVTSHSYAYGFQNRLEDAVRHLDDDVKTAAPYLDNRSMWITECGDAKDGQPPAGWLAEFIQECKRRPKIELVIPHFEPFGDDGVTPNDLGLAIKRLAA